MFIRALLEAIFAFFLALAIIYALTYSFYCLFLSEDGTSFTFEVFSQRIKSFTKRDNDEHGSYDKRSD